jgi:DNA-binding transcriptional ArsR family regulator
VAGISAPDEHSLLSRARNLRFSIISANIVRTSLRISWPAVAKHLRVLERAGLLQRRRSGRSHILIWTGPIRQADEWIASYRRFWEGSLDAPADYLERGVSKSERPAASRSKDRQRKR